MVKVNAKIKIKAKMPKRQIMDITRLRLNQILQNFNLKLLKAKVNYKTKKKSVYTFGYFQKI